MGDFNLDLFNQETCSSTIEFLNTFLSSSFVPLTNRPTRVTSNTSTLIDNIFCNHFQQLENPDQGLFISSISLSNISYWQYADTWKDWQM